MADIILKPGEQPLSVGQTTSPADTHVDVKNKNFIVHIFFDGTGNNRFNTESHRNNPSNSPDDSVSYTNYFSNIALLFMAMKEEENIKRIYIEGSGTTRDQEDAVKMGMGLAAGPTGRESRVSSAFIELNNISQSFDKSVVILNVYGFSRGAAWARHFCSLLKKNSDWKGAKINFVGIFDTVSSDGFSFTNDVQELGLDIGKPEGINFIAHITAQDDYRKNFALTRIKGAVKEGIGFECSFPGAHSDIGGGYQESSDEIDMELGKYGVKDEEQGDEYIAYEWFVNKGYYLPEQINIKEKRATMVSLTKTKYRMANRTTTYHYQFICADIMKSIATLKANYQLRDDKSGALQKGISDMKSIVVLNKFHKQADKYITQSMAEKGTGYVAPLLDDAEMKEIYNRYIHNSLQYGTIANKGTIDNKTKNADGSHNWHVPIRSEITEGYRG